MRFYQFDTKVETEEWSNYQALNAALPIFDPPSLKDFSFFHEMINFNLLL